MSTVYVCALEYLAVKVFSCLVDWSLCCVSSEGTRRATRQRRMLNQRWNCEQAVGNPIDADCIRSHNLIWYSHCSFCNLCFDTLFL